MIEALLAGLTVLAYLAALQLYLRTGRTPLLLPVVVAVLLVIAVLMLADIPISRPCGT